MSTSLDGVSRDDILSGEDRYVNFATDVLGLRLSAQQKRILRAVATDERVVIMSGNGVGKSYVVAVLLLAFVATNLDSTALGTSGSYSQFVDAVWRPMRQLHEDASERVGLPGTVNQGGQPTLEIDSNWFAKVVSPRDPGDLEGRHADAVLVLIEESDKRYITKKHFESAASSITDDDDRMVAICNPPKDESNAVFQRLTSDRWTTIQFSTLDSHNVKVDAGEIEGPKIPGITDLGTVVDDWEEWNGEEWPGIETARAWSDPDHAEFRTDLDERWYRRRAGVMPPAGAGAHRPFTPGTVSSAWSPTVTSTSPNPDASGVDVARSGDRTVAASVYDDDMIIEYSEQGTNHLDQAEQLARIFRQSAPHPIAVDAVGEGSGLEDILADEFADTIRFNAGSKPAAEGEYYDRWAEGLHLLGSWLEDGGRIHNRKLREELNVAGRTIEYREKHMASRGDDGAQILKATSKSEVKDRLDRSPDHLDAAMMAIWARDAGHTSTGEAFVFGY